MQKRWVSYFKFNKTTPEALKIGMLPFLYFPWLLRGPVKVFDLRMVKINYFDFDSRNCKLLDGINALKYIQEF